MKTGTNSRRALRHGLAGALLVALGLPAAADAQVRTKSPGEFPGPPYYARIDDAVHTDILPHDGTTAAIVFYRRPECVPRDFNMMLFFDLTPVEFPGIPVPLPRAYACPMVVQGFETWRNAPPPVDSAPMFASYHHADPVPVWFVSWTEFLDLAADGVVTIGELEQMSSLRRGHATQFTETLHPTGGAINPALNIVAKGKLDDGQGFLLHHSGNFGGRRTRIEFH